jgi:hypothetical protein
MAITSAPMGPPVELSSRSCPESPEVSRATDHHPLSMTASQLLAFSHSFDLRQKNIIPAARASRHRARPLCAPSTPQDRLMLAVRYCCASGPISNSRVLIFSRWHASD